MDNRLARAIALFWIGTLAVSVADWGLAWVRGILLVVFAAVAAWMTTARSQPPDEAASAQVLKSVWLIVLAAPHLIWFAIRWLDPHPLFIDIGTTTIDATRAILHGGDPYSLPIDPQADPTMQRFDGFKYTPMTALAYLPLIALLGGQGGLLLTNLLLDIGVAAAVWRLAARLGGRAAGRLGVLFYLSLLVVPAQLFQHGVTDFVATLPLLIALACYDVAPALAGFCIGLSIAAKPPAGLLLAAYCLPRRGRVRYVLGCVAGMVPVFVFLVRSGRAMIDNTIVFNLVRPTQSTAWLNALPGFVGTGVKVVALAVLLAIAVGVLLRNPSPFARCALATIGLIIIILVGPGAHTNYLLWWMPMFCALLAAFLLRPAPVDDLRTA